MTNFYNPAAGTIAGDSFFRLDFLATAPDMGDIIPFDYALVCRFAVIAFVGAEMLKLVCCWLWSLHDNAIQDGFQLCYIMSIRPGDDDRQRDAMLFHQQMAFASFFFPGPSGSDQPPPEPKVLWSWHYRHSAMTSHHDDGGHLRPLDTGGGEEGPGKTLRGPHPGPSRVTVTDKKTLKNMVVK